MGGGSRALSPIRSNNRGHSGGFHAGAGGRRRFDRDHNHTEKSVADPNKIAIKIAIKISIKTVALLRKETHR